MTFEGIALLCAAVGVGALFALPLAISPLPWARRLGWHVPERSDLALYFGRCLGAVIAVLVGLSAYAAFHPPVQPVALAVTAAATALMVPVHVVGFFQKRQPLFETVETFGWLGATLFYGWLTLRV
jgi:hypothetical protein